MNDAGQPPAEGHRTSDREEMQVLLQSCGHWMLLCKTGIVPDLAKARPLVDVKTGDGAPAMAMFAAIAELVIAGETVLVACRAAARMQKVTTVAQRMGWQVQPVPGREPDTGRPET